MITLHHLQNSQSFRIVWLLEELNIPYELKIYERDPKTRLAPAEFKSLHKAGTAPVITDGDLVLAETNAIVDYILDKYSDNNLRPKIGDSNRTDFLYYYHMGQGSLMPMLIMMVIFNALSAKAPLLLRPIIKKVATVAIASFPKPRVDALFNKINEDLANRTYLAGAELTAADIVTSFDLMTADKIKIVDFKKDYPNIATYLDNLKTLDSFKRANTKIGEE